MARRSSRRRARIYLGRYLRWNSWDILLSPLALGRDVLRHVIHPVQNWQAWALTALLASLLVMAYWLLTMLPRVNAEHASGS